MFPGLDFDIDALAADMVASDILRIALFGSSTLIFDNASLQIAVNASQFAVRRHQPEVKDVLRVKEWPIVISIIK